MSRRVCCDHCQEIIPWVDGENVHAKRINKEQKNLPPITVRGQGYALDFCGPECLGHWGLDEAERLESREEVANSR